MGWFSKPRMTDEEMVRIHSKAAKAQREVDLVNDAKRGWW